MVVVHFDLRYFFPVIRRLGDHDLADELGLVGVYDRHRLAQPVDMRVLRFVARRTRLRFS